MNLESMGKILIEHALHLRPEKHIIQNKDKVYLFLKLSVDGQGDSRKDKIHP